MKLPKVYEPDQYEPTIYALWESSGAFSASGTGVPFSVIMPPPNANGNLHIGHALDMNLKDILVRYQRMRGRDAIFIPGADHAGFETWVVYEKKLAAEGKSRFDFSREELYSQVWDFVASQRGSMELQLRALGTSASWNDLVFTLDEKVIRAVYETFEKLWKDDLIYRGERIVNYCTFHQTSFADIEVEHREEQDSLWTIAYPLLDRVGEIHVATTRPETMLGDTAIAVHPEDERYKDLIGQHVMVPVIKRSIPIIADEAVEQGFGTGAVKVTPAHDPNDFDIGQRHDLEIIQVIGFDGKMTDAAGSAYAGLDVLEARKRILLSLQSEEDALKKTEDLTHAVGHCYKCGTRIQPLLKDQWFLKVRSLAERAKQSIEDGDITFTPTSKAKLVTQYLDNLRDWNLSRQIPWGIPIPAFQSVDDPEKWIFDSRVDQETITVDGVVYRREEDTFDTWFSSGQWPYIVTDALEEDGPLKRFYPSDLMETGSDLLDRWVARMIMLGLYRTETVPFKEVYMHGMVLDEHSQKMSKSKGNVINPMEIIATYGSDALRLGIVAKRSAGQNQAFSTASVIAGRNFCNKLWNMARFIEPHITDAPAQPEPVSLADHWVISRMNDAREAVENYLAEYRFAEAADTVYHTVWNDVADWYLEASKLEQNPSVMAWVLETCLTIAHPFAPFVTEAIWTTLERDKTPLISRQWPPVAENDAIAAAEFDQLRTLVIETRFVAADLPGGKQTMLFEHDSLIADNRELVARLAKLAAVEQAVQPQGLRLAVPNREAWLKVSSDTLYEHQSKLENRLAETRIRIEALKGRLGNDRYVAGAPPAVVEQTRSELAEQEELVERLSRELEVL